MARVLWTSLVAPSQAGTTLPERSIPLTYLDAMWLRVPPVEQVFFYAGATCSKEVISNLTDSLSKALRDFYPLAGRLRLIPGTPNRYELHYKPGDGVTFTVAEYHQIAFDELATDEPTEVAKIFPLLPRLPEGGAVLALQANMLRGGLALAMTYDHAAFDGVSCMHFLRNWALAAAVGGSAGVPEPPVIDRSLIGGRDDLYNAFVTPRLSPPSAVESAAHVLATFTLPKEYVQSIKDAVAREAGRRRVVPPPRSTSTVAVLGFIWHCYLRAQPVCSSGLVYFLCPADQRARLEPPLPDMYLGNCVGPCTASAARRKVAANGADGLFTACATIAASIDEAVCAGPGYWDGLMERMAEVFGAAERPLSVAGSLRFRVYDIDFGFGPPVKRDIVSVARTGAISLAEGRGGGIEVGISLPPDGMDRFRECFADTIESLLLQPSSQTI